MTIYSGSYASHDGNVSLYSATRIIAPNRTTSEYKIYNATLIKDQTPTVVCPPVLSITTTATSNTNVRVTFSEPVIVDRSITDPFNYVFDPYLIVSSVTPNNALTASYVDLEVLNMTNQPYTLTFYTAEIAS